jgi:Tfp pilus assembly protein PilF
MNKRQKIIPLVYLTLTLATVVAYEQVRHNDFVSYDDFAYVTENPDVSSGITRNSVIWAFTNVHLGNWHPLTGLSHMLDCQLFGLEASWHHLTNLFFHVANTLLLFAVLKRITGAVWRSAFVAAAFVLHPLHVESVAWIAERKDVLSGFFWMLTVAAYIRYAQRPAIPKYLLVVLAFTLGLMAKPMLVTLPFVLLLLDYWPLRRFQWSSQGISGVSPPLEVVEASCKKATTYRLITEKIPLFVLTAASSVVTFMAQKSQGAIMAMEILPIKERLANVPVSYVSYIGKMIYPTNLAVLYPIYKDSPAWQPIVSLLLLAVISAAVIYAARRRTYLAVGWLWYIGTLVPVIGLVQVGSQAMADRYTYLPSIGIFIMVAWGAADLVVKWQHRKIGLRVTAGLILVVLLLCTRVQVRHWRNSLTLFKHAITVTKNNFTMHYNYANALRRDGRLDQAIRHFEETVRINPKYYKGQNNLALAYYLKGKIAQAITSWHKAIEVKPDFIDAINNLAWIRATHHDSDVRDSDEAVRLAKRTCELTDYNRPDLLDTLAAAYATTGRFDEAVAVAERAFELAQSPEQSQLAGEIQDHLRFYRQAKPYIEPAPHVPSR